MVATALLLFMQLMSCHDEGRPGDGRHRPGRYAESCKTWREKNDWSGHCLMECSDPGLEYSAYVANTEGEGVSTLLPGQWAHVVARLKNTGSKAVSVPECTTRYWEIDNNIGSSFCLDGFISIEPGKDIRTVWYPFQAQGDGSHTAVIHFNATIDCCVCTEWKVEDG